MIIESKGNMYSWVTHEWNPVKGECSHGCTYCYMKRWGRQNPIHICPSEFRYDLGSGRTIFVVSGSDLFADDVPEEWINDTLARCKSFDNTYLFQSKNPTRIGDFRLYLPEKSVVCTTIETNRQYKEMGNAPCSQIRASAMNLFFDMPREFPKYVTIEPIMDFDINEMVDLIKMCNPIQVNIGADSGNNKLPEPTKEKVLALIDELKTFTTIDQKRNLTRLLA